MAWRYLFFIHERDFDGNNYMFQLQEMKLLFPNAQKLNRGSHEMKALVSACKANDVTDFIVLHEHRGEPDGMIISHLPFGPTAYFNLSNCIMRHDIPNVGTMSEAYPHLIFHNFNSRLGERVSWCLVKVSWKSCKCIYFSCVKIGQDHSSFTLSRPERRL